MPLKHWKHGKPFIGYTACIVAQGPSLRDQQARDWAYYAHTLYPTIAIKDTYKWLPYAPILFACDRSWWFRRWKEEYDLRQHTAIKVTLDYEKLDTKVNGIQSLKCTGNDGMDGEEGCVRHGRNSGHQAINLCVNLGPSKILLFGYDFCVINGRSHCHDNHVSVPNSVFDDFKASLYTALGFLKKSGVKIVNCSEHSAIPNQWIPYMNAKEAIAWGRIKD